MTTPARQPVPSAGPFGSGARVIAALARMVEIVLDGGDLTLSQYRIVSYLAGQPSIPTHLARWLGVKKQSMSRQLDVLVERGYLERSTSSEDRRRVIYAVTPAGRTVLRASERRLELALNAVLSMVDPADAADVRESLETVAGALAAWWDVVQRGELPVP